MFPDIGRTIGQIFGAKKKKETPFKQPINQGGRGVGVIQNKYQQPQGLPPVRQQQAQQQDPFQMPRQQVQQPSTLGQPIQPVHNSSNPVNDVGKFLLGNTAKLANTGYAGLQAGVGAAQIGTNLAMGNRPEAERIATATGQEVNRTLNKGGLFNEGGFFKNTQDAAHPGNPVEFGKRFSGAGLASAAEIAPIGRGVTAGGKVTGMGLTKLAGQGAAIGGLGSAGSQLTTTGKIDPLQTSVDALAGGALAPLGSLAGKGLSKVPKPKVSFKSDSVLPSTNRPAGELQKAVEEANNAGNVKLTQQLEAQLPDQAMNPDAGLSPEVKAKLSAQLSAQAKPKAFNDYTDEILKNLGVDTEKGLVKGNALYTNPFTKTFNKAQQGYIEGVDKLRDKTASKLQSGLESKNPVTSKLTRAPQVAFKNFGQSDLNRQILDTRSSKIQAAGKVSKMVEDDLQKAVKATGNPEATNERIYRVLEDPEYLQKVYGNPTKLGVGDLSPAEKVVMDKLVKSNKVRNDVNLATGVINPEQHAKYADGFHSPRIYDLSTSDSPTGVTKMLDNKAGVKRKDISKIDDAVTSKSLRSPTLASSIRLETALRNKANVEALDQLADAKLIRGSAPNKNYVKLEGKKYGKYDGKYIDKQIKSQLDQTDYFNSDLGQATGDLMESYQSSPLGSVDRFFKKTKTVYAPATNIGNISSNVLAFSGAANVNPATMAFRMTQAGKQLYSHSKKFNPNVYRAEKAGLFAGDTGKQLVGVEKETLATLEKSSKNPLKKIESFYGNTDKAAALGLFNEFKARGLTDAQAVRRAHKATQNYSNAGRGINVLANSPVVGKPFARFTPELIRIMKNNALYNPVGTAAKVGGLAAGSAALSQAAGETTDERQAREGAVGQTGLPGTGWINDLVTQGKNKDNVSLNLPVGDSAVNVARATGLNFPIEPGGDPNGALGRQLAPWADPTRTTADGEEVIAPNQLVSSLTLKPIADQIANRDFMGRQVSDPENKVRSEIGKGKSQYENPDGSRQSPGKDAEQANRARALVQNYVPLANEGDALLSAATKNKDYYGKDRTMKEAALRTVGLKTESNTKDVREKRVQNKEFFEGKDKQVKDFLTKNKDVADAYFKFNDSSRDRFTNKKSSALVKPEKWAVVKGETSGKLFKQLQREAMDDNKKDGKPIDPIYQLKDPARQKELVNLRATPPGEDIERQEILRATSNWFKPFEDAESKYYKDSSAYYDKLPKSKKPADQNDRVKAYGEVKYPEQTELVKGYYRAKAENPQKGKDYFKANANALSKDFSNYKAAKLDNINQKREILGLDPIKPDSFNNVTFGYEDDESKVAKSLSYKGAGGGYARGGGRRGGGGSSEPDLGKSAASYAVSLKSGGQLAKPKVTAKKRQAIKIAGKSSGKPKVAIKASKV